MLILNPSYFFYRFIINELIQTEKAYVDDLKCCIEVSSESTSFISSLLPACFVFYQEENLFYLLFYFVSWISSPPFQFFLFFFFFSFIFHKIVRVSHPRSLFGFVCDKHMQGFHYFVFFSFRISLFRCTIVRMFQKRFMVVKMLYLEISRWSMNFIASKWTCLQSLFFCLFHKLCFYWPAL